MAGMEEIRQRTYVCICMGHGQKQQCGKGGEGRLGGGKQRWGSGGHLYYNWFIHSKNKLFSSEKKTPSIDHHLLSYYNQYLRVHVLHKQRFNLSQISL